MTDSFCGHIRHNICWYGGGYIWPMIGQSANLEEAADPLSYWEGNPGLSINQTIYFILRKTFIKAPSSILPPPPPPYPPLSSPLTTIFFVWKGSFPMSFSPFDICWFSYWNTYAFHKFFVSLKVLSSHSNWGVRLDSFDTRLKSRCPAIF